MSSGSETATESPPDFETLSEVVRDRLAQNLPIRRTLPGGGRLRIDRQLPFLCVCRPRAERDEGTKDLVTSEAAYLYAPSNPRHDDQVADLCREVASMLREHFGMFLFVEVTSAEGARGAIPVDLAPGFVIHAPESGGPSPLAETLASLLGDLRVDGRPAEVSVEYHSDITPKNLPPLMGTDEFGPSDGPAALAIRVRPVYRDPQTGTVYPKVLQQLRKQLSAVLRKTVAEFTGADSASQFRNIHYQALGPSALSQAAGLVDQELCEVSESFDFLIQSTPVNAEEAWGDFKERRFRSLPDLHYPHLPFHISLVKRQLFAIELERVEDPSLAHLFYEKQAEIDLELTALSHLERPEFLQSTLQLYGTVDEELAGLATAILKQFPWPRGIPREKTVRVEEVVGAAREELNYYHSQLPEFNATVEVLDQLASGLMVSQHRLLLSKNLKLRVSRLDPLLHHEVGTHLLTYFNGRSQPLRQLYAGLAGYEELQEGLAVLAEYLTGGLSVDRLRTLAGRVVAADSLVNGATFIDTFELLRDEYRFSPRASFSTTLRAYRGGGSTKDIIYLRGLVDLLAYLSEGHDVEPLYVGKLGLQHVPYLQELRRRQIIKAPALLPRFWTDDAVKDRLEEMRGKTLLQLTEDFG